MRKVTKKDLQSLRSQANYLKGKIDRFQKWQAEKAFYEEHSKQFSFMNLGGKRNG